MQVEKEIGMTPSIILFTLRLNPTCLPVVNGSHQRGLLWGDHRLSSHWRDNQTVMLAMIKGSKARYKSRVAIPTLKSCQMWNLPLAAGMAAEAAAAGALSTVFCTCRLFASQVEANVGLLSFSKKLSFIILPWAHEQSRTCLTCCLIQFISISTGWNGLQCCTKWQGLWQSPTNCFYVSPANALICTAARWWKLF